MTDILQAARSYYGLADTESCTTQLFTNQAGQTCVAFEIPLSNEDFAAIVQRMQNMQQPDTQPDIAIIEGPTVEAMREAYNALSKAERGKYKSFARYVAECSKGIIDVYRGEPYENLLKREVVHVDAPEEPEPVSMDAVWLDWQDCLPAQQSYASDHDEKTGKFLVQWAMLTDEQKAKAENATWLPAAEVPAYLAEKYIDWNREKDIYLMPNESLLSQKKGGENG